MLQERIYNAKLNVAKIIKKYGLRKLRKIAKHDRPKVDRLVNRILKRYELTDTNVERYLRLQFTVALCGLEYVWLPDPERKKHFGKKKKIRQM